MRSVLVLAFLLTWLTPFAGANAAQCSSAGNAAGQYFGVQVSCTQQGHSQGGGPASSGDSTPSKYVAYRWASVCTTSPNVSPVTTNCAASLTCGSPRLRNWTLWGRLRNGQWVTVRNQCFPLNVTPEAPLPTVTPGDVLEALRRVGLPALTTKVQPANRTLVNLDTIFWTDPRPVDLRLTILGQAVDVVATPTQYHWVFGDGASMTTSSPGAPYPDKTVTHRYQDAHVTVEPHVEVAYGARFRVGGGSWQDIDGTVTTVGPSAPLRVAEATPLLSGNHR